MAKFENHLTGSLSSIAIRVIRRVAKLKNSIVALGLMTIDLALKAMPRARSVGPMSS